VRGGDSDADADYDLHANSAHADPHMDACATDTDLHANSSSDGARGRWLGAAATGGDRW
jgi:hypothetical protein